MRVLILTLLLWGCARAAPQGPESVDLATVSRSDLRGTSRDLLGSIGDLSGGISYGYPRVNEVAPDAAGVTLDEYIELIGANADTPLFNWTVSQQSADGSSTQPLVKFPQAEVLPARSYLLIAAQGSRFAAMADITYSAPAGGLLAAAGGAVALLHGTAVVDSVGWGAAVGTYVEGNEAAPDPGQGSASRLPDGVDTNVNRDDVQDAALTPGAANHR